MGATVIGGGVPVSGGSATFLSDTFTRGDVVTLASHSPETGGTWTQSANISATTMTVNTLGYTYPATDNYSFYYNTATPASADYTTTITGKTGYSTASIAACVRMTSGGGAYCAMLFGDGEIRLVEKANGDSSYGVTQLATQSTTANSTTTTYTVKMTASGTSLTASVWNEAGDTQIGSSATAIDPTLSSAGYAGVGVIYNNVSLLSVSAQ